MKKLISNISVLCIAIVLYGCTLCLFILLSGCSPKSIIESDKEANSIDLSLIHKNDWEMSNNILSLINAHRTERGKQTLIKDTLYASAYAIKHSLYMMDNNDINHNYFFNRSSALKSRGASKVAENVAYAYSSAETVVKAWLKSDGHRRVIEDNFTHVGFGVMKSENNQRYYFTTLFYK